jgi:hypothetical protein
MSAKNEQDVMPASGFAEMEDVMPLLLPFIIGPAPHLVDLPPPFADLAKLNLICAGVLALCLLGIYTSRNRLASRLPLIALLSTLGMTAITFGVNVFYARNAEAVMVSWPSHLHPLGSFTLADPYSTPFKILYGCTTIIICATAIQVGSTIVTLLRHNGAKTPAIT